MLGKTVILSVLISGTLVAGVGHLAQGGGRETGPEPLTATAYPSDLLLSLTLGTGGHSSPLDAIVQLQGLKLPPIKVQGQSKLPLTPYGRTRVFTVQAQIQDQSSTFLVDTGASTTMLSADLVALLNLKGEEIPGDRLSSAVAGKNCPSMDAQLHKLPAFRLGEVQVHDLRGLQFKSTVVPKGLSGVLGMNLLEAFDLKINPRDREIELADPTPLPPQTQSLTIPLEPHLGVMLGEVYLNGVGPFKMLLDTGAGSTFISPTVVQKAKLTNLPQQSLQIQGFCGLEDAKRLMMPSLKIGLHQLGETEAIVLDAAVIKTLGVDGILGQNVFNQFFQHWRFTSQEKPDTRGSLLLVPQR